MDTISKIETSIATLEIMDEILYLVLKQDANVDLDAVKETVAARKEIQDGRKMLVLVDNRSVWQVTGEAQAYSASKEVGELSLAMAILSGSSLPARLISNFFIRFNKVHSPTKIFKSERNALKWLENYKQH